MKTGPQPLPDHARSFFATPGTVGVTGHRLNRLTPAHEAELAAICDDLFKRVHADCALLSCHAEGTDTIVAEAWPRERSLRALLPGTPEAWRKVVAEVTDPERFDRLIARASVTSLAGGAPVDFGKLAKALVDRSDRIFAVWDGAPGKPGGTGSVVAAARAAGKPVLHLRFQQTGFAW